MSIILKLVGNNAKDCIIECPDNTFSLEYIYSYLLSKEIKQVYLDKIKFIIKGIYLSELNKLYSAVDTHDPIYLYTPDTIIRNDLIKYIFTLEDSDEQTDEEFGTRKKFQPESYNKLSSRSLEVGSEQYTSPSPPPYDESDECINLDTINPNEINCINEQILKQFEDPDFINLLKIVINKPHLLGLVSSYLVNGTVSNKIEISPIDDFKYNEQYLILEELGFVRLDVHLTKSIINHFNGHLNMCIRYILWHEATNLKVNAM